MSGLRAQGEGRRAKGKGLKALILSASLVFAIITPTVTVRAQPLPPELTQPVNDFAHVIDPASAVEMDREIRALKAATGDVVVVATVETFAPYADIQEYAVKMFENHGRGIGDKGKDNGLLVVLAVKDRRVRAEVGYDLEQFVTDGYAGEVTRQMAVFGAVYDERGRTVMAPAFARGEYGAGLLAGLRQFIARIAQARGVTIEGIPQAAARSGGSGLPISPGLIIFVFVIIVIISRAALGLGVRPTRRWGAGPWSGWNSGVGPFGGGGGFGGGGFGGGFGGFGGGRSGGGGGGAGW